MEGNIEQAGSATECFDSRIDSGREAGVKCPRLLFYTKTSLSVMMA